MSVSTDDLNGIRDVKASINNERSKTRGDALNLGTPPALLTATPHIHVRDPER